MEKVANAYITELVGKIPYDNTVIKSINELKPITFYKDSIAEKAIENMKGRMFYEKSYRECKIMPSTIT